MSASGFALFDTPIGRCGIAWGERGVAGVQLPEAQRGRDARAPAQALPGRAEAAAARDVQRARRGDRGAAARRRRATSPRSRSTWTACRRVPPPRVRGGARDPARQDATYGELAARARLARLGARGRPGAGAQSVRDRRPLPPGAGRGRQGSAASRRTAASRPSCACWRSRARRRIRSRALFEGDGALGFDPRAAVAHLRAADPTLARAIDAVGPLALELKKTHERVRRARRGDRLPAADRQGCRDDLRAACARSSRARTRARPPRRSCAPPTRSCAAPGCRARSCSRCATSRKRAKAARSRASPKRASSTTRSSSSG